MPVNNVRIAAFIVFVGLAAPALAQGADPARLDLGAKVYGSLCTTCHGPSGDLVAGVNLSTGQFKRATNDLDVMNVILTGIPGTAMPANNSWQRRPACGRGLHSK